MIKKLIVVLWIVVILVAYLTSKSKYEYSQKIDIHTVNLFVDAQYKPSYYSKNLTENIALVITESLIDEEIFVTLIVVNLSKDEVLFETEQILINGFENVYTLRYSIDDNLVCISDDIVIDVVDFENELIERIFMTDYISEEFCIN